MKSDKLDEMIGMRQQSEVSEKKRTEFQDEYFRLLLDDGYDDDAEKYLFEGLQFGSAQTLFRYMHFENVDGRQVYKAYTSGTKYQLNDNGVAFKVMMDVLCQAVNAVPQDMFVVADIIKTFGAKVKNKKGKINGNASQIVGKYFVFEINEKTSLPDFGCIDVNRFFVDDFKHLMLQCLETIEVKRPKKILLLGKVKEWLATVEKSQERASAEGEGDRRVTTQMIQPQKEVMPLLDNSRNIAKQEKLPDIAGALGSQELLAAAEYLGIMGKRLAATTARMQKIDKEVSALKAKEVNFYNLIGGLKNETTLQKNQITELRAEIDRVKMNRDSMAGELSFCKSELVLKNNEILNLQGEINKRKTVISVISDEKDRASRERLNAIALRLRSEYDDFKDAMDMEMTIALGENLRHQLDSVFKMLIKNGIDVERRIGDDE